MTRCPNCYNSITPDTSTCPSCAYLLIQRQSPQVPEPSTAVTAQAQNSGELQTVPEVQPSGRLEQLNQAVQFSSSHPSYQRPSGHLQKPDQTAASGEEKPRTAYRAPSSSGNGRRKTMARKGKRARELEEQEAARRRKKFLIPIMVVGLVVAVVLLAPATQLIAPQVDAQTSISTLAAFRSQPSKRQGMTVDECVNDWLEQSRKAGDLVNASGWFIKQIRFDRSKVVLGFSFEEKGGVKTAEWLADVHDNSFAPKNDLAAQVYGNK